MGGYDSSSLSCPGGPTRHSVCHFTTTNDKGVATAPVLTVAGPLIRKIQDPTPPRTVRTVTTRLFLRSKPLGGPIGSFRGL